jgi:hypothetical protein
MTGRFYHSEHLRRRNSLGERLDPRLVLAFLLFLLTFKVSSIFFAKLIRWIVVPGDIGSFARRKLRRRLTPQFNPFFDWLTGYPLN